jgi:hypothetical protein
VYSELYSCTDVLLVPDAQPCARQRYRFEEADMHAIIYLVGLIVVIMFILSFLGLR